MTNVTYFDIEDGEFRLHINNGGLVFKVTKGVREDKVIPFLEISAWHFEVQTNHMILPMSPKNLNKLGLWISEMSEKFKDEDIEKLGTGWIKHTTIEDNKIVWES